MRFCYYIIPSMQKAKEQIKLGDHFNYKRLLRFTLPSIVMMVFTSIYGVVDGFFISNFAGKTAFAGINFIMPYVMIIYGAGFMIGAGGSALTGKLLGENKKEEANKVFSMMVYFTLFLGCALGVVGVFTAKPMTIFLGATDAIIDDAVVYGRIMFAFTPAFMLQALFQSFLVTAEKPRAGLFVTVAAGVTNIVLDATFIALFKWGIVGAAVASGIGQIVGACLPLIYFLGKKECSLKLVKTGLKFKPLFNAVTNGSSELLTNISSSVVGMLFNYQLLKFLGENGVAAYGTIMYVQFIFNAVFIGYAIGVAPIISYNYGAENHEETKNVLKKSIFLMGLSGVAACVIALLLSSPLSKLYVGYDKELYDLTVYAFRIYAFAFVLNGFNIFMSSFFTALNDGLVSAIISFMRTLVFQILFIMTIPIALGSDGLWASVVFAEIAAFFVSAGFLIGMKKKYKY